MKASQSSNPTGVPMGEQERAIECFGMHRATTVCNVSVRAIVFPKQQIATENDALPRA